MAFVKYRRRRGNPVSALAFVTVQQLGRFSMNQLAFELLGRPERVELLFDPEEHRIGFRPTTPDDVDSYRVRKIPTSNSYIVSGESFLPSIGHRPDVTRRYQAELVGDVLAIDLREPGKEVSLPRKNGATQGARHHGPAAG